jgi:hypothetical protein
MQDQAHWEFVMWDRIYLGKQGEQASAFKIDTLKGPRPGNEAKTPDDGVA